MKKVYNAPLVEYLAFSVYEHIAEEDDYNEDSDGFNNAEMGWT